MQETILHRDHLADLRASALSDEAIEAGGFRTTYDPLEVCEILGWKSPAQAKLLGPCMVFPFHTADGELTDFARIKPLIPLIVGDNGKRRTRKYEQPIGVGSRAYFPPGISDAIRNGKLIGFTEGEKKAASLTQHGLPTIGLTGIWNWVLRNKNKPKGKPKRPKERQLIPSLAAIDWDRDVVLIIDGDERRNSSVIHAMVAFAIEIAKRGANPTLIALSPLKDGDRWRKCGADDLIFARGMDPIWEAIGEASSHREEHAMDDYREQMRAARRQLTKQVAGVSLDRSPTGAGKTFSDIVYASGYETSLMLVPTHSDADEAVGLFGQQRPPPLAAKYPSLNKRTCANLPAAEESMLNGFSPGSTECLSCFARDACDYKLQVEDAKHADHSIATHKRGELSLPSIIKGKQILLIEEDPRTMFRPIVVATKSFAAFAEVAEHAAAQVANDQRERTKESEHKRSTLTYLLTVKSTAETIADRLDRQEIAEIELPPPVTAPPGAELILYKAKKAYGPNISGDVVRLVRDAVAGRLERLLTLANRNPKGEILAMRACGVYASPDLSNTHVHISDASTTAAEIEALLDLPPGECQDITPEGRPRQQFREVQFPTEITKQTKPERLALIAGQVLALFPHRKRIGVIAAKQHAKGLKDRLPPEHAERIVRIEHYYGSCDRGSNVWTEDECDLLVCLGTPWAAKDALQEQLLRAGAPVDVVDSDGGWRGGRRGKRAPDASTDDMPFSWPGWVEDRSEMRAVWCGGYSDWHWHFAFQQVVIERLRQAVGRGRSACSNGMDVVAVSCQDIGLPLLKQVPLTDGEFDVLKALLSLVNEAREEGSICPSSLKYILKRRGTNETCFIAAQIFSFLASQPGRTPSLKTVQNCLRSLEDKHWIQRLGGHRSAKWTVLPELIGPAHFLQRGPGAGPEPSPDPSPVRVVAPVEAD